jgi:hypothetical protein
MRVAGRSMSASRSYVQAVPHQREQVCLFRQLTFVCISLHNHDTRNGRSAHDLLFRLAPPFLWRQPTFEAIWYRSPTFAVQRMVEHRGLPGCRPG